MAFDLRNFLFYYMWNFGVNWIPGSFGSSLRSVLLKFALKKTGKNVQTATNVVMNCPQNISLGNNVVIGKDVHIGARGGIEIGDNSTIDDDTILGTGTYKIRSTKIPVLKQETVRSPLIIEKNVTIGQRCILVSGAKQLNIGENSIIEANSHVVRDVPARTRVGGNPALVLKKLSSSHKR
jgi:acetyltransferase-like isoleucine patch superfamily enzyme